VKLKSEHIKILLTVKELNMLGVCPNNFGVYKILSGCFDLETKDYTNISTFDTLTRYSAKKISNIIMMLVRYDYLQRVINFDDDKEYLKITEKGIESIKIYRQKHKITFSKSKKKKENNFAKI